MKKWMTFLLVLCIALTLSAKNEYIGQNAYHNDDGQINIAADAVLVIRDLKSPYTPFYLFFGADKDVEATISRDSKMPSLAELRSNYNRDNRDLGTYLRMGKQALITSNLRGYDFQENVDFFPGRTESMIHTQEGSISSNIGFFTRVYFKNSRSSLKTGGARKRNRHDTYQGLSGALHHGLEPGAPAPGSGRKRHRAGPRGGPAHPDLIRGSR
jgi:hypothetical protein